MKKLTTFSGPCSMLIAALIMISLSTPVRAQNKGTFNDSRDNRVYAWVKIGTLTWMAENLKFASKTGSWVYGDDSTHLAVYGRMYNWKTAQSACPKGWHVPSDKEWNALIKVLEGPDKAGLKMQAMDTVVKVKQPSASGTVALTSLMSGVRHPDGSFGGLNYWGGFWSATSINDSIASNVLFAHGRPDISLSSNDKKSGFTVRCVKK